jgi:acyl-CoA dehydrogenase
MQYELPEALVQVRDSVRRFVADEIEPGASVIEETNDIPDELLAKAAALGLFGLSIPEEYDGSGTSEVASCVALEALSHGPAGVVSYVASSAPAVAIRFAGTEAQRRKFLPALARVERLYRDCRAYRIVDGTSDIQRMMIASNLQKRGIGEAMAPGGLV